MAKKTLEQLREELVDAFDTAVSYGKRYAGSSALGPEHLKAAAQIAQAIVTVDDKIDRRLEEKNGLRLPGKA